MRTLLADLTSSAKLSATSNHWDESAVRLAGPGLRHRRHRHDPRRPADLDPHNPLIPNTVRWLMAARKANAWESTEATAASLRGLVDYISAAAS